LVRQPKLLVQSVPGAIKGRLTAKLIAQRLRFDRNSWDHKVVQEGGEEGGGRGVVSCTTTDSGMNLVRSHRLMHVQIPQVVMNLIFSYSGRDFAPSIPILWFRHLRGVGREVASGD